MFDRITAQEARIDSNFPSVLTMVSTEESFVTFSYHDFDGMEIQSKRIPCPIGSSFFAYSDSATYQIKRFRDDFFGIRSYFWITYQEKVHTRIILDIETMKADSLPSKLEGCRIEVQGDTLRFTERLKKWVELFSGPFD